MRLVPGQQAAPRIIDRVPGTPSTTPQQEDVPAYGGGLMGGSIYNFQGSRSGVTPAVTTRQVGPNELVSNQINRLNNGNSAYIRSARSHGNEMAAEQGSAAGSYYAGNAQRAAIDASLPIAAADASTYGRTASENMAAQNDAAIAGANNQTSITTTGMSVGGQLEGQRMRNELEREQGALNRNFQRGESGLDRDFRRSESGLDRAHDVTMQGNQQSWQSRENSQTFRRQAAGRAIDAALSDPSFFSDPVAVEGFIRRISEIANGVEDDIFGPGG